MAKEDKAKKIEEEMLKEAEEEVEKEEKKTAKNEKQSEKNEQKKAEGKKYFLKKDSEKKESKTEKGKEKKGKEVKEKATIHSFEVLLYPLISEKAVNMIEAENKITFIVGKNTNKSEVKKVVEEMYGIKVDKVNVLKDLKGRKKAIVKINKEFKAEEIATKLGVI